MSKKSKRARKQKSNEITKGIFSVLEQHENRSFNYKQIAGKLRITDTAGRNLLIKKLGQLRKRGEIEEVERGKYKAIPNRNYFKGIVDITVRGNAYIICEDFDKDIYIPTGFLNKALHGDEVEVYVFPRRRNGKRTEGKVTRIIQRKRNVFVGLAQLQRRFAFVVPTDIRMYVDIFIPRDETGNAKDGDKVLVEITDWSEDAQSPQGKIIEVLGKPGTHHTEMHAILAEYGLPRTFPEDVERFASALDVTIDKAEVKKRRDMRNVTTFTIDPKDAKDFDDALSFRVLENGNYEIGIHIADVSHYVVPGSILDEEAYRRGTSVYLVDRVVPMLPEILSNNVCSLRPREEKYTFSTIFEMDDKAEVVNTWFGRTLICSERRFAYEEVQSVIEAYDDLSKTADAKINTFWPFTIPKAISLSSEVSHVEESIGMAILTLNKLAKTMREERMKSGAVSFDRLEVKFLLNQENDPTNIYYKTAKEANKLIEEFMLLANRSVAAYIGEQKKSFVYRVHDEPDDGKLTQLNNVISRFGYHINLKNRKTITNSLNTLLKEVQGKKEQNLIDMLAIRSMSKAIYTTRNIGHYGLAFDYYTHFTSPIRRYPDIMAHRLLQHYLDKGASVQEEAYEEKCKHASTMENLAANAERDSVKYMQIKFMENHKNEDFVGVISGITEWSVYVEIIETKCEGMIRIRDIKDDYYTFNEQHYALVGEVTRNTYQLGDEVIVKVRNTDLVKRHLDFELLGKKDEVFI